ncbi:hypothetical protein [Treponema pedis]|uniref:hypothetical protein n=1 Tax=Treponema pedis TaxID=409322 RepID=UPI00178C7BAC|nr:hypothetical protein [Treponema pedis]
MGISEKFGFDFDLLTNLIGVLLSLILLIMLIIIKQTNEIKGAKKNETIDSIKQFGKNFNCKFRR